MRKLLVGFLLLAAVSSARADQTTQDVLNEIDAVKAPTTAPARISEPAREIGWSRLVRLFAPSLATAAAIAVACGVAGTFVLLRREALIGLALPQVVAVGAAVGMRMAWPTLPPALVAAALALVYLVASKRHGTGQSVLPSLYVGGMALSFLVIANHGRDVEDLQNLFTGVDVAVSPQTAWLTIPLLLGAAVLIAILWRRWLLMAQASAAAELAGLRPAWWDALFLSLLAAILLLGTNAQGVVLVLALLFLPAAAILPWAKSIPEALIASAVLGCGLLAAGFYLSNTMQWPMSQTVGGIGFAVMALSHALVRLKREGNVV